MSSETTPLNGNLCEAKATETNGKEFNCSSKLNHVDMSIDALQNPEHEPSFFQSRLTEYIKKQSDSSQSSSSDAEKEVDGLLHNETECGCNTAAGATETILKSNEQLEENSKNNENINDGEDTALANAESEESNQDASTSGIRRSTRSEATKPKDYKEKTGSSKINLKIFQQMKIYNHAIICFVSEAERSARKKPRSLDSTQIRSDCVSFEDDEMMPAPVSIPKPKKKPAAGKRTKLNAEGEVG